MILKRLVGKMVLIGATLEKEWIKQRAKKNNGKNAIWKTWKEKKNCDIYGETKLNKFHHEI